MSPLQIKRQRAAQVDPKQVLRAHVDQLPVDEQRKFIAVAVQLIAERTSVSEAEIELRYRSQRRVEGERWS